MATTEAVKTTWIGRAARMLLVFVLVFGTSFHVEMAFAKYDTDKLSPGHTLKDGSNDTIDDLTVVEVVDDEVSVDGHEVKGGSTVTLEKGDSKALVAVVGWEETSKKNDAAEYVEWEWSGDGIPDGAVMDDKKGYALSLKNDLEAGADDVVVEVTCKLNEKAQAYTEGGNKDHAVKFKVKFVAAPEPAKITGLTVKRGDDEVKSGATVSSDADEVAFTAAAQGEGAAAFEGSATFAWRAGDDGEHTGKGDSFAVKREWADAEGKVAVSCAVGAGDGAELEGEIASVEFTVAFGAPAPKVTGFSVKEMNGQEEAGEVDADGLYRVAEGGSVTFAAVPAWEGEPPQGGAVEKTEWTWSKAGEPGKTEARDALTITGEIGDSFDVTCKPTLTAEAAELATAEAKAQLDSGISFKVVFVVPMDGLTMSLGGEDAKTHEPLKTDQKDLVDGRVAVDKGSDYQLIATVADSGKKVLGKDYVSYANGKNASLKEASRNKLTDLKWSISEVADKDGKEAEASTVAEIDEATGALKVRGEGSFKVTCLVVDGAIAEEKLAGELEFRVGDGHVPPDQGDPSFSQDKLHVTGVVASDAVAKDAPGLAPSSSSSSGKSSTSSSSKQSSSSSSGSSGAEQPAGGVQLDKTYTVSEVEALPSAEVTFNMRSGADTLKVTGQGPTLESLLKALGIENMQAVHELEFVDRNEVSTKVSWSSLSAGAAVVATKSYVHDTELEKRASTSADAAGELLPNTCFRIIYDGAKATGAGIEADALRYIKEIRINPGDEVTPVPQPEDPEAPFTVSIAYAPAPLGYDAVLSPVVSREIAGATFDFLWEESSDEGKTWKTAGANQTLKVKVTKKNLGHWFRVTVNSDIKDPETGKSYSATSKHVELNEPDDGFSVQLNYDPPIAGGIALFQSIIIDLKKDVDMSNLEYIWEMSEDGCKTWEPLAKQYQGKSTLSIQTDPIDPNEPAGDAADANLIYIRVRVVEKTAKAGAQPRVRISNEQPLTVHVGDTEKGTGEQEKNNSLPSKDSKPVDLIKDPTWNNSAPSKRPGDSLPTDELDEDLPDYPSNSRVVEDVEDIEDVDENDNSEDAEGETNTAPTPDGSQQSPQQQANTAPQLHINEGVTQQILEQQEAVQEYVESTVPGARWTALQSSVASGDDARAILSDNPFAPLVIPTGLGITAAGVVEKLLFFRRQIK